jgi:uncharacterized RDD family membrane protein YckC
MSESSTPDWSPPEIVSISDIAFEPKAGFRLRFLAHICDFINSLIVAIPFQIAGTLLSDSTKTSDADGFARFPGYETGASGLMTFLGMIATLYVLAYWTGSRGGSPLRVRLGVLVLDENDGSYIGTKRAVYRGLMSNVSQLALLLGYFWMLWDPQSQTWHDRVAHSVVVKR